MRSKELYDELSKHSVNLIQNVNKLNMAEGQPLPWLRHHLEKERREAIAHHAEKATTKQVEHDFYVELRSQVIVLPIDTLHRLIMAVASELTREQSIYANYYEPTSISPK